MAKKATGEIGSTLLTQSAEGISAKIVHTELPTDKEGLEEFFASRFVTTFNQTKPLGAAVTITNVKQLDTSDLDFAVSSPIADYMELAEVNPRSEPFGRSAYRTGKLPVYECAKWLYFKIIRKKMRAYGVLSKRVILLLYIAHWQFLTGDQILECLRSFAQREGCDFPAVFILKTNGTDLMILELAHPYSETLRPPGDYREMFTINGPPGQSSWTFSPSS